MAQTITPVGHGGSRRRWAFAVGLHTIGAALAAGVFGALLGAIGGLLGAPRGVWGPGLAAAVAALYAGRELFGVPVPVPAARRQVPEWWRRFFSPGVAAFLYGVGLGVGFFTFLSYGTLVAVAAAALGFGNPALGAAMLAPFGLARGLSVLVTGHATQSEAVHRVVDRLDAVALGPLPRRANALALVAIALTLGLLALSGGRAESGGLSALLLAAVFAWAATAKLLSREDWRDALQGYALGRPLERSALYGVPLAEAAVCALILLGLWRAGALLALGLLAAFSLAILRARAAQGRRLPCGCFGGGKTRDFRLLLARNVALGGLAAVVLAGGPSSALSPHLALPSGGEVLPAVLALAGVLLSVWVFRRASRAMSETSHRGEGRRKPALSGDSGR